MYLKSLVAKQRQMPKDQTSSIELLNCSYTESIKRYNNSIKRTDFLSSFRLSPLSSECSAPFRREGDGVSIQDAFPVESESFCTLCVDILTAEKTLLAMN